MTDRLGAADISSMLAARIEALCQTLLPAGKRVGNEWKVGDIRGNPGKSLSVHLRGEKAGIWSDFANDTSGDGLDLVKGNQELDTKRAIVWAKGWLGINGAQGHNNDKSSRSTANGADQHAAGDGAAPFSPDTAPLKAHPTFGEPVLSHEYCDAAGRLIFIHCRFDLGDGKKTFRPLSWQNGAWAWKDPDGKLPLYALADLAARPEVPVLLVEGEKTCEISREHIPDYVITTWPHGSGAVGRVDWAPLKDRDVTAWPDADEPGRKGMRQAAEHIAGAGAASVRIVKLPTGLPDGWDLGDVLPEGGTEDTVRELIKAAEPVPDTPAPAPDHKPLVATPLGDLVPAQIPLRQWLLGTTLIRGHVKVLIATGGMGKTQIILQRGISIVTGRDLSGGKVHETGRVWIFNDEDETEELDRRIAAICQYWSIDPQDLRDDLHRNSGFDRRLIVAEERDGDLIATPDVDALIQEIRQKQIIYLAVDPFVRVHRVRENANEAIDFVAVQFARIAIETNCAIELAHHTRKPPIASSEGLAGNADSARGAGALVNAARIAETLYPMSERDRERYDVDKAERRLYLRVDSAKANMSPPQDRLTWFKRSTVILPNGPDGTDGDHVGVIVQVDLSDAEQRAKAKEDQTHLVMATRVALVLEDRERIPISVVAKRLIDQGFETKSERTVRRQIEGAIPTAPTSVTVEIDAGSVRLFRTRQDGNSTDRMFVVREML